VSEDEARKALEARLAELDRLDALSAEGRAPVTLQQDSVGRLSRIDAMQQQAMAQAEQRRRAAERSRHRVALTRLDKGDWGWCAACGETPLRFGTHSLGFLQEVRPQKLPNS
jgi:DnaK suppressor protein